MRSSTVVESGGHIVDDPVHARQEVLPSHGATGTDFPMVGGDGSKVEGLFI